MKTCYTIKLGPCALAVADLMYVSTVDAYLITRINVPRQFRGQGHARELLRQVLDEADAEGATLVLEICPSDGLNDEQLEAWYKRHGFGSPRRTLLGGPSLWIRTPQEQT